MLLFAAHAHATDPVFTAGDTSSLAFTTTLNAQGRLARSKTPNVISGQDGGASVDLGGGYSFWMFGDTNLTDGSHVFGDAWAKGYGSTPAVSDLTFKVDGSNRPTQALPFSELHPGEDNIWPSSFPFKIGSSLYVFYVTIAATPPGWFAPVSTGLAKSSYSTDPQAISFSRTAAAWDYDSNGIQHGPGQPIYVDANWLYFGSSDDRASKTFSQGNGMILARVPVGSAEDASAYTYLTDAGTWNTDRTQAKAILGPAEQFQHVPNVTWNQYLGVWLMVGAIDTPGGALTGIGVRTAPAITGPWSSLATAVSCPAVPVGSFGSCYFGQQHVEFNRTGDRVAYWTLSNWAAYDVFYVKLTFTK